MFTLAHNGDGAPNNAFNFNTLAVECTGTVRLDFTHPRYPNEHERKLAHKHHPDVFDGVSPWPIGKLEMDYDDAVRLRDALDAAIKKVEAFPDKSQWIRHNGESSSERRTENDEH